MLRTRDFDSAGRHTRFYPTLKTRLFLLTLLVVSVVWMLSSFLAVTREVTDAHLDSYLL